MGPIRNPSQTARQSLCRPCLFLALALGSAPCQLLSSTELLLGYTSSFGTGIAVFDVETGQRQDDLIVPPGDWPHYYNDPLVLLSSCDLMSSDLTIFSGVTGDFTSWAGPLNLADFPRSSGVLSSYALHGVGGDLVAATHYNRELTLIDARARRVLWNVNLVGEFPRPGPQLLEYFGGEWLYLGLSEYFSGEPYSYLILRYSLEDGAIDPDFRIENFGPDTGVLYLLSLASAASGDLLVLEDRAEAPGAFQTRIRRFSRATGEDLGVWKELYPDGALDRRPWNLDRDAHGRLYVNFGTFVRLFDLETGDALSELQIGDLGFVQAGRPLLRDCSPDDSYVRLQGARFRASVTWRTADGQAGVGHLVPGASADSANFWYFAPDIWELQLKVVDGCEFNDFFWVYGAASTDVEFTVRVEDLETGALWTHTNPQGVRAGAITDSTAFPVCP